MGKIDADTVVVRLAYSFEHGVNRLDELMEGIIAVLPDPVNISV